MRDAAHGNVGGLSHDFTIVHNLAAQRFEAELPAGLAHADYRRIGNTLNMIHTEVPVPEENRGVGAELVTAALDYARANGLSIMPTCPYVRAYMRKHADTHDLLARGARL
jgi:uncharacterized protein